LGCHGFDGQQFMSGCEEFAEEPLRVLLDVGHDALLHEADFAGDVGNHFGFAAGDGGHDRVGEAEWGGGVEPAGIHAGRDCVGFA
jgi:hypothetical protein